MKRTRGTTDAEALLAGLSPKADDDLLKEDMAKADKVRATFLSYRKQLVESLKVLDKYSETGDQQAKDLSDEVTSLIMVLDRIERRKDVSSDTLLDFMSQLRKVGGRLDTMSKPEAEGGSSGPLGEQLRQQKQAVVEDDKKQDERFEKLAKDIGEPVDGFIKKQGELVGAGGGGLFKTALASWLGPAAPLVKLVDDLVDIDGKVAKGWKAGVDLSQKVLKATVGAPAKLIKSGGEWAQASIDYFKSRARNEDLDNDRRDKRMLKLMKDQISNMKDMKRKLTRMAGAATAALSSMLLGLSALLSKAISGLGGMVMKGLAGLVSFLPGRAFLSKIAGMISEGASRIFRRGGQSPGQARKSAKDFSKKATRINPDGTIKPQPRGANGRYIPHPKPPTSRTSSVWGKVKGAGSALGKGLGAAGGAYGMVDGYQTIKANKGKDFFDGGLDSRAGGYGSSIMGGAAVGATIGSIIPVVGTVVGGIVGGAVGGLSALIADNEEAVTSALAGGWKTAKDYGSSIMNTASSLLTNFGPTLAKGPLGAALSATASALGVNSDQIKEWAGAVGGWLTDTAKSITDSVGNAVSKAISSMGDVFKNTLSDMGDWLRNAGLGDALDWGKEKADAVAKTYNDTKKNAESAVKEAWSSVTDWFDKKSAAVGAAVAPAVQSAGALVANASGNVLNAAASAKDSVKATTGLDLASILPDSARAGVRQVRASTNYDGVKDNLVDASKQTGVGAGTLARFAQIESGFDSNAKAGTSSAGGLYQFTDSTWAEQLSKHGAKYGLDKNTSKFDPRANSLLGAEYIKSNKERLSKVTGGQVNDTQLYMAHFLGAGGASQFFKAMQKNPDARADLAMPDAAKANTSIFYKKDGSARSFKEVYALMDKKIAATDSIAARAEADAGGTMVANTGVPTAPTLPTDKPAGTVAASTVDAQAPKFTGIPGVTAPTIDQPNPALNPSIAQGVSAGQSYAAPYVNPTNTVNLAPSPVPVTVNVENANQSYAQAATPTAITQPAGPSKAEQFAQRAKALGFNNVTVGDKPKFALDADGLEVLPPKAQAEANANANFLASNPQTQAPTYLTPDGSKPTVGNAVAYQSGPRVTGFVSNPMPSVTGAAQASSVPGAAAVASPTSAVMASGIPGLSKPPGAAAVASADVHYIPKSTVPPTVDTDVGADKAGAPSGGASSGGMKSSLSQIPFVPGDQNLLALNITGLIG